MTQLSEEVVERVAEAIGEERDTKRYFSRRSIDKSCYEAVHDTDPDGPITDDNFQVVSTWPDSSEAAFEVWNLVNRQYARAAIAAYEAKGDIPLDEG
jgi:hypothetical protein